MKKKFRHIVTDTDCVKLRTVKNFEFFSVIFFHNFIGKDKIGKVLLNTHFINIMN
jgi:hypothetical protein